MIELKHGVLVDRARAMIYFNCGSCGEYDERSIYFYEPSALDQLCSKCSHALWRYDTGNQLTPLTTRQIAEAFPEEINKTIVPRLIRQHKSTIREFEKEVKTVLRRNYDQFTEDFAYACLKILFNYESTWHTKSPWEEVKRLEAYVDVMLPPPPEPEGKFNEGQIERARNKSILELFSFEKLRRNGQRYSAKCCFHTEKSPSFVIYSNNTYHCFGCGANGDSIKFVMQLNNMSFKEAIVYLT